MKLLTPEGWFEWGHDFLEGRKNYDSLWLQGYSPGTMVWSPPPGGARHSLEELIQTWQKIQKYRHIFVFPHFLFSKFC